MPIWPRAPDEDPASTRVLILADTLSPSERRDSLLQCRVERSPRTDTILLLDLLVVIDDTIFGGA